jgi:hypothetical protein
MKDIKIFINESLTQGQLVDLVRKLPNDVVDIYDALESILSWNDDDTNSVLLSMDKNKSLFKAIEENNWWKDLLDWANDQDADFKISESKLKSLIKKHDEKLTEIFLNMFEDGIKELKSEE